VCQARGLAEPHDCNSRWSTTTKAPWLTKSMSRNYSASFSEEWSFDIL
jgi:hypothetical protein